MEVGTDEITHLRTPQLAKFWQIRIINTHNLAIQYSGRIMTLRRRKKERKMRDNST